MANREAGPNFAPQFDAHDDAKKDQETLTKDSENDCRPITIGNNRPQSFVKKNRLENVKGTDSCIGNNPFVCINPGDGNPRGDVTLYTRKHDVDPVDGMVVFVGIVGWLGMMIHILGQMFKHFLYIG